MYQRSYTFSNLLSAVSESTAETEKERGALLLVRRGGTAKARTQFQNQLDAVERDTAFARILVG
jgi:hypothetical protein